MARTDGNQRSIWTTLTAIALAWLALIACQPVVEVVEVPVSQESPLEVTVEVTRVVAEPLPAPAVTTEVITETVERVVVATPLPPPGSAARPLQLVFPATIAEGIIAGRTDALLQSLAAETGLAVERLIVADVGAAADLLCEEPDRVMAFLPALPAVWATARCGAQPALVGERADVPWHAAMYVVRATDPATATADLAGARWGIAETDAVVRYLEPQAEWRRAGIEVSEPIVFGSDNNALLALLDNEVDVVTVAYNPPIMPYAERIWVYGEDDPEVWRSLGVSPSRHPIGYIEVLRGGPDVGGYRIRDARAALFDARPTVFDETRVLDLTAPLPNGALVVAPSVPWAAAASLIDAMERFGNSEACAQSFCSPDFYDWQRLSPVASGSYEPARLLAQTLGLDEAGHMAADPEY